jgi:hypothetical protein
VGGLGLPEFLVIAIAALISVGVPAAIVVICVLWMRSTRASQKRVDEQNERIIELLEKIAGKD